MMTYFCSELDDLPLDLSNHPNFTLILSKYIHKTNIYFYYDYSEHLSAEDTMTLSIDPAR